MRSSSARCTAILSAAIVLSSCSGSMPRSPAGPSPLVVASCPPLTPLIDASFGATTTKLLEVVGIYRECRAAAIGAE